MSVSESHAYDVFLSHGSPDKLWVRQLRARLEAAGVVAYFDEVDIEAGDNFVCNLSNGIGQTRTFVIVVSQGTMARPWVEHEWTAFMATHGPKNRIIPILLDHVQLPPFLRPYQAIHAVDRNVDAVAARIARAVGKGNGTSRGASTTPASYTGQSLIFTVAPGDDSDHLAVTSADGTKRTVKAPWRQDNKFGIALMDFEQLTRASALDDAKRADLAHAAQTIGAALFGVLVSDDALRTTFAQATAPGERAVVTLRSDDDVLLSLPWELLFHESSFLVRDAKIDVVRSTTGAVQFETQLSPPSEPFTVVTHISAPEGKALNTLSYEEESYRITHALTDHCPQTATELGTLEDLVNTVTRAKPRGIHFSGHGNPGELVFENDEGFEDAVAIDRLVTDLRNAGNGALPPFFFLASCYGNTPASPEKGQTGSASSAAQLHRQGVAQVVGYYGPIIDELSTRAEEALYAAIAAGEPTRLAVAKARAALQRAFDGDGDATHKPAGLRELASPVRGTAVMAHAAPFAWAQLVFYHRGPEHPLGTPASREKLRQREAALTRTYRNVEDRAFLATGFIGRRRDLHELRRRRNRGDRVFILQGLGGLGKTTLAGHLLPMLADAEHTINIWCRRSEGESDRAEALVGQLLAYARARFGSGFEQVVGYVDRSAGDDAAQRFASFLQVVVAQQPGVPVVVYFDNLESLLQGPDAVALDAAPDSEAFGTWRSEALPQLWRAVVDLSAAVGNLYIVASCRYRNDDLMAGLLPVSPLADVDLFRLMAWFPALRRLSTLTKGRLAARLSGHPRAVEFMDALIAVSIRKWESSNGEWIPPTSRDEDSLRREWEQLVDPVLPTVQERIWSDLLLATLWDRVLDTRAQRMLFRMTLLRRPWDDGLMPHLADVDDDAEVVQRTVRTLSAISVLEQVTLTVASPAGRSRRPFYTVHAATAAFVKKRFVDTGDLTIETHRRVGAYLEQQAKTSPDLTIDIEAGHHLFEAAEYDRANELLGAASVSLRKWGRVREGLQLLLPFLADSVRRRLNPRSVGLLLGEVGLFCGTLGETRRSIALNEEALVIFREFGDRRGEGSVLGNLGNAYGAIGEQRRAIEHREQALLISREIGDRQSEGRVLCNLGNSYFSASDPRRAIEQYEQALAIAQEIGDRSDEGNALGGLGNAHFTLGEPHRAIDRYKRWLDLAREARDRRAEGRALGNLGIAYARLNDLQSSLRFFEQQLAIVREIGDRREEGHGLHNLGLTYANFGEYRRAVDCFTQGRAIGQAVLDPQLVKKCEQALQMCADKLNQATQPKDSD